MTFKYLPTPLVTLGLLFSLNSLNACYAPDETAINDKLEECGVANTVTNSDGSVVPLTSKIDSGAEEECILQTRCGADTDINRTIIAGCLSSSLDGAQVVVVVS